MFIFLWDHLYNAWKMDVDRTIIRPIRYNSNSQPQPSTSLTSLPLPPRPHHHISMPSHLIDILPPIVFTALTLTSLIALLYHVFLAPPPPPSRRPLWPLGVRPLSKEEYKRQLEEYAQELAIERQGPVTAPPVHESIPAYWDGEGAREKERYGVQLRRRGFVGRVQDF